MYPFIRAMYYKSTSFTHQSKGLHLWMYLFIYSICLKETVFDIDVFNTASVVIMGGKGL